MRQQILAGIVLSLIAATSHAGTITLFRSSAGFLAAAPIVSTTTFDDSSHQYATRAVRFDDIQYQLLGQDYCTNVPQPCWQTSPGDNNWPAASSPNRLVAVGWDPLAGEQISFGDGGAVAAIGFAFTTPGHVFPLPAADGWRIVVYEVDGGVHFYVVTGQEALNSPVPLYFGFLSSSGIRDVVVRSFLSQSDVYINWGFDDVSRSAIVPIPAAVWFLGSALGALGWVRRRVAS